MQTSRPLVLTFATILLVLMEPCSQNKQIDRRQSTFIGSPVGWIGINIGPGCSQAKFALAGRARSVAFVKAFVFPPEMKSGSSTNDARPALHLWNMFIPVVT